MTPDNYLPADKLADLSGEPKESSMTQLQSDLLSAAAYLKAESDDGATMTVAEAERIAKVLRKTRYTGAEMKGGKPLEYLGEPLRRIVTHVMTGPLYGLAEGWAILSIRPDGVEEKTNG